MLAKGTMLFKHNLVLQGIPLRQQKYYTKIFSGFSYMTKISCLEPFTEGSVDLDKFPASRVGQLAKKLESSKATVHHIKQVASDSQVTQINLLQHQTTELPTTRHNKKRRPMNKQRQAHHKTPEN